MSDGECFKLFCLPKHDEMKEKLRDCVLLSEEDIP